MKETDPNQLVLGCRSQKRHMVRTVLQSAALMTDVEDCPVQKAKQRSAFAPNYIHSLDSTHMMMTATECRERGATPSSRTNGLEGLGPWC